MDRPIFRYASACRDGQRERPTLLDRCATSKVQLELRLASLVLGQKTLAPASARAWGAASLNDVVVSSSAAVWRKRHHELNAAALMLKCCASGIVATSALRTGTESGWGQQLGWGPALGTTARPPLATIDGTNGERVRERSDGGHSAQAGHSTVRAIRVHSALTRQCQPSSAADARH